MTKKQEPVVGTSATPIATISQRGIAEAAKLPVEILESVMVSGDLSPLTSTQRLTYYGAVCKSLGLNPLTKPFAYITLNGKLTLYALKACTDQLRANHGLSVRVTDRKMAGGLISVTAQVQTPDSRVDEDIGVVPLGNLKGEDLANAMMKAVTKAKRRATLSLCGMGWLDESEVDSIAGARTAPVEPFRGEAEPVSMEIEREAGAVAPRAQPAAARSGSDTPAGTPEGGQHSPLILEPLDPEDPEERAEQAAVAEQPKPASALPAEKDERYPAGTDPDNPACPQCGGPMWDYRERSRGGKGRYEKSSPAAPDFRCRSRTCAADKGVRWPRAHDAQPSPAEADQVSTPF